MSGRTIPLWEDRIPYNDLTENGFIPSVREYLSDSKESAVLVCPGGAYIRKAEHEGKTVAETLNDARFTAFVLDYRVSPCDDRAPLNDVLRAIRLLRSMNFGKIAVMGFSAGGHAACGAATLYREAFLDRDDPVDFFSSRPDALISCYSVVSMTDHEHIGSVKNLLGEEWLNWQKRSHYSAELQVDGNTPPAFIWHTTGDGSVPVENSINLAKALAAKNVPFELHVFPGGRHGMGLAKDDPVIGSWVPLCLKWLETLGFQK